MGHGLRIYRGLALAGVVALGGLASSPALAAFTMDFAQVGANVVGTGSGTIDFGALTVTPSASGGFGGLYLRAATPNATLGLGGPTPVPVTGLAGAITGPDNLGTSPTLVLASSGSGDPVGINSGATSITIFVPNGYVSGAALSDSSTWNNVTLAQLGMNPGSYVWNWGSGVTADSFTINIGASSPVPEPGSLALLALPMALLLVRRRRAG